MGEYSTYVWSLRLLKIVKFTGFSAFSVENGKVKIKVIDAVCFSFSFCLGIFISINSFLQLDAGLEANNFIVVVGNQIASNSVILIAITTMLMSFVFREDNWSVLLKLHEADLKVELLCIVIKLH